MTVLLWAVVGVALLLAFAVLVRRGRREHDFESWQDRRGSGRFIRLENQLRGRRCG